MIKDKASGYRNDLDLLKGFAILAVVLFHMHISDSGYLGVDVFFVINGFLVIPKVVSQISDDSFYYWRFLERRIVRLLPLLLVVSFLSLLVGYYLMLPDDYENLGESVIASSFFSNNILSSVTTKDYWKVANDYKPLMHTWYIGILVEFYVVFPLIVMFAKWLSKKMHFSFRKSIVYIILILSTLSFLLYLNPSIDTGDRFYLLQYRFFEMAFGGIAGMWIANHRNGKLYINGIFSGVAFFLLLLVVFFGIIYGNMQNMEYDLVNGTALIGNSIIPPTFLLVMVVILTIIFVVSDNMQSSFVRLFANVRLFCVLGMMSYSLFLWHQPILAFYRYSFASELTPLFVILFFISVVAVSYVTYHLIEKKVRVCMSTRIVTLLFFLLINGFSIALYMHAGVVRDVPELNVYMDRAHRNMHEKYVDRIFTYNKDFPMGSERKNVLVIGNSFGRDLANVLLESHVADSINLSYIRHLSEKYISRINQADYLFFFGWKHDVPNYVWNNLKPGSEIYGYGTKSFGMSNGIIYRNRHRSDYFLQTARINPNFIMLNKQLKDEWKDKYIDFLEPSLANDDESVVVFTEDHKMLSKDTRHLTKDGAMYFAKKLDFKRIFK